MLFASMFQRDKLAGDGKVSNVELRQNDNKDLGIDNKVCQVRSLLM